jgi:ATP-binding cassette, subfamily B, bacterial
MNREVYKHLLHTYGRRPAVWFGLFAEIVRTLLQRVVVAIIVAHIATALAGGDLETARHYAVWFLVVYVAGAIIGIAGELIATLAEDYEYENLTMVYYRKLTGKDMSFYRDNQTGYLVSLFRQYLDSMMQLVRLFRGEIAKMVVSLAAPVIVLFVADARLGLVTLGIVAVQIIYIMWSSSRANRWRKLSHEIYRKVTGEVSDQITNIVAFKSGGAEKRGASKVFKLVGQETQTFWQRRKITMLLDFPRELVTAAGVTLAFFVVLNGSSGTAASVGLIMLTLTYMFQIVRSVGELPNLMTQHDDFITKLHPTLQYLGKDNETIKDPARPKKLTIKKGAIAIENLCFSYPSHGGKSKRIPVFNNLNLTIKGGQQVGIVGLSGAGKSTLVSLLMRFDDPQDGSMQLDGTDLRQVRQNELHQNIAYVPQEPLLFHSTIRENIAYFNDTATEKDIVRAAKAAHAHEFISQLPGGYDTIVGERGVKLSGGQKQRVVIARAILKNAPIMIFDEATSALDTESEKIIQAALPHIIGKHTAIVIAHRLSTVAGLDRILVMHNGQIIEDGPHDELLKHHGRYYSLWQKQIAASDKI